MWPVGDRSGSKACETQVAVDRDARASETLISNGSDVRGGFESRIDNQSVAPTRKRVQRLKAVLRRWRIAQSQEPGRLGELGANGHVAMAANGSLPEGQR
jgi:hypothetical protein